jgi:linoleoyl-CoA desaturase
MNVALQRATAVPRITFSARDATGFVKAVQARVPAYFAERGLPDKGGARMAVKSATLLALTVTPYALILSGRYPPLVMLGLAALMGVGLAGIGFAVAHDALHGAYSHSPRINALMGFTFDLFGANGYMWKITHNVIHHTYTNIDGVDEDLAVSPLLRLSPSAPLKPWHRFQHLYGWLAYGFATLFWVFVKDYKYFLQRDLGPYRDIRHPKKEWAVLIAGKLLHYGWSLAIPLWVLPIPLWQVLLGVLVMHLTAGTILGVVFQLAHVVEGVDYPAPDAGGAMEHAWLVHEMATTANFAPGAGLLSWYVGGLNYQIEHHLFPKVCSLHYPEISRIVKRAAEEYGVTYHERPTLASAIASHYRMLNRLGRPAVV